MAYGHGHSPGYAGEFVPGYGFVEEAQVRKQQEYVMMLRAFTRPRRTYEGARGVLRRELEDMGMGMYTQTLLDDHGFQSLREIKELAAEDLARRGVLLSHARRLLAAIPTPAPMRTAAAAPVAATASAPTPASQPITAVDPAMPQPTPTVTAAPVAVQPHAVVEQPPCAPSASPTPTHAEHVPLAIPGPGDDAAQGAATAAAPPAGPSSSGGALPPVAPAAPAPPAAPAAAEPQPLQAAAAAAQAGPPTTPAADAQQVLMVIAGPEAEPAPAAGPLAPPSEGTAPPQYAAAPAPAPPVYDPRAAAVEAAAQPVPPPQYVSAPAPNAHPPNAAPAVPDAQAAMAHPAALPVPTPQPATAPAQGAPNGHHLPVAFVPPAYGAQAVTAAAVSVPPPAAAAALPAAGRVSPGPWARGLTPAEKVRELREEGWQVTHKTTDTANTMLEWLQPCVAWEDAGLPPQLLRNMPPEWVEPTGIQSIVLGNIQWDRDLVVSSSTGSGKTAAYILPILRRLMQPPGPPAVGPRPYAVILGHTMELVEQVFQAATDFVKDANPPVNILPVMGRAENVEDQVLRVQQMGTVHIVVGTVGRMATIARARVLDFSYVQHLVIDEADAIARAHSDDTGYQGGPTQTQNQLDVLLNPLVRLRPQLHTTICSATLYKPLQELLGFREGYRGHRFVRDGAYLITNAATMECKAMIYQLVQEVDRDEERVYHTHVELHAAFTQDSKAKVVVFARKARVEAVADAIRRITLHTAAGPVCVLVSSGDVEPRQRLETMTAFRQSSTPVVLVSSYGTTGRGIDETIPLVVLYDLPNTLDDYKHAIGRTGRAGKTGRAVTFFSRVDDGRRRGGLRESLLREYVAQSPTGHEWRRK